MATTINQYSVGLRMDATDYINKAALSATETRKLTRDINSARSPAEKYSRDHDRLSKALQKGGIDQKTYQRLLDASAKKHKVVTNEVSRSEKATKALSGAMGAVAPQLIAAATAYGALRLAVGVVTSAYRSLTSAVTEQLGEIDKVAKNASKLGMATDELVGLRMAAAEMSGMARGQVDMSLQRMTRRLSEAANGTGEAKQAIIDLGLDAQELAQKGPGKAIRDIADAMQNVDSQGERLRIAFKLFDSEGAALVNTLANGSEGLDEMQARAEALGLTFTDINAAQIEAANDAIHQAQESMAGAARTATVILAPAIKEVADDFASFVSGANSGADSVEEWQNSVLIAVKSVKSGLASGLTGEGAFFGIQSEMDSMFGDMLGGSLTDMFTGAFSGGSGEQLEGPKKALQELEEKRLETVGKRLDAIKEEIALMGLSRDEAERHRLREADANSQELAQLREMQEARAGKEEQERIRMQREAAKESIDSLQDETRLMGMNRDEAERYKLEQAGATDAQLKRLDGIQKERQSLEESTKLEETRARMAQQALSAAEKHFETERKRTMEMRKQIAEGPGDGIEVGSAGAARFMATQANQAIAAQVMPDIPTPGEDEIVAEAKKQFQQLKTSNEKQDRMLTTLQDMLQEAQQNGFRRVR